jgi:hypothetical protein
MNLFKRSYSKDNGFMTGLFKKMTIPTNTTTGIPTSV